MQTAPISPSIAEKSAKIESIPNLWSSLISPSSLESKSPIRFLWKKSLLFKNIFSKISTLKLYKIFTDKAVYLYCKKTERTIEQIDTTTINVT